MRIKYGENTNFKNLKIRYNYDDIDLYDLWKREIDNNSIFLV